MVPDPGKPWHCPGSIVLIASDNEISIDGYRYNILRADRNRHEGSVLIFITKIFTRKVIF